MPNLTTSYSVLAAACSLFSASVLADFAKPLALKHIPDSAISVRSSDVLTLPPSGMSAAELQSADVGLMLPLEEGVYPLRLVHRIVHNNGDITSWGTVVEGGKLNHVVITQGPAGAIADIRSATGRRLMLQQAGKVYLVDLAKAGLVEPDYEGDVPALSAVTSGLAANNKPAANPTSVVHNGRDIVIVDIMMLYETSIAEQYPDGLAETLMTHLVAKANQAFVDSAIGVQLRLVHRQFVPYDKPSNFSALNDLRQELSASNRFHVDNGLSAVYQLREQYGADIVAMIRTHELNEREVCGVAMFPNSVPDVVANISNVGISGGSNCIDTFTHEIGHNFGAGHQFVNGASVGATTTAGALIVPGKFNTIMSSIGTGDVNRNYKLNRFSNPALNCAAQQCGDELTANNADAVQFFALSNSALRDAVVQDVSPLPPPSDPDSDGDGVTDLYDAFPHDASEQADSDNDGTGDNADVFPNDSTEWADFDGDGIGNNADTDDDNDGVPDTLDHLPFDASESVDSDGDGVGNNKDQLPNNFQDFNDSDADGIGNRFDTDNDNDGVADFDTGETGAEQLIVVSAGNDSIIQLELDGSGETETLYQAPAGGFSFRSDLIDFAAGQLVFVQFSDVMRLDRHTKQIDTLIQRGQLNSNFAAHVFKTGNSQSETRLYVSHGMGPSYIEAFSFAAGGTSSSINVQSEQVFRDLLSLSANVNLFVERDTNQIMRYTINNGNASNPTAWAEADGLDKPEHLLKLANSILVTNAGSKNVSQFSLNGAYLGEFIAAGSGGLGKPSCIAADNNGDVYLCSEDTDQILKYSGVNGAPLGEVMNAAMGLDKPVSLALVGAQLDQLPFDPTNDTDNDGVANNQDAFPLDPSRSAIEVTPPPIEEPKSGGSTALFSLLGLGLLWRLRKK